MFSKSCTTLVVLLVACHGNAQASDDTDEQTIAWLAETFPQDPQNNRNVDLPPTNQNKKEVDDIVNWVKESVQPDPKNKMKPGKINLDPDNVEIKNTSFSQPAETSNKFDNTIESTTAPAAPCETEDGRAGVCVLYYQCDPDTRKVIGDGTHLIDIRIGGPCSHYLDVCCRLEDRVSPSTSTASPAPRPTHPNKGTRPVQDVLPMATDAAVGRAGECGWNNPDLFVFQPASQDVADRGVYANYGDFPWMVALLRKSGTDVWVQDDYIGGGSLIHPSVVMTALHKLLQVTPEELKCRAGEWDTQTDREEFKIQERDADRFVSHKEFFRASVYNDIALVFLKAPFELATAPHIGAACLARVLPSHADCFSMGWGKDVQSSQYVHILKKVKLSLVERKTCEELLHTNTRFRHIPNFVLHESLTCAGGEQYVDTCQGDGGSPLVCPIGHRDGRTRYAVVGMVAYGLACGKQNVPGVYVNVPHLYDWVEQQMKDAGYDSSTFSY